MVIAEAKGDSNTNAAVIRADEEREGERRGIKRM